MPTGPQLLRSAVRWPRFTGDGERSWIVAEDLIVAGLTGGILAILLRQLILSFTPKSVPPDAVTGERVLYFGVEFKVAAFLFFLVVLFIALMVNFVVALAHDYDRIFANLALAPCFGAVAWQIADAFTRIVTLRDDGLRSKTAWFPERFVPWSEVRRVTYSTLGTWFVIEYGTGQSLRVSSHLRGLADLYDALRTHLPPEAFEKARGGFNLAGVRRG
jgi:hypothetical protein